MTKVPEAGENEALKLEEACHLHVESDRDITDFLYKRELLQSPVKSSLVN